MATTIGVGVAVFAGCEAISLGVGSVGCAVLAGAASGAVSGALDCKSGQSMGGCIAAGAAVGAVTGLVGGVLGKVVATVGGRVAGALISRLASRLESGGQNAVRDLAETCAVNSFAAGTLVLMADGSKKPIDQIQPGDIVMAGDPQKGTEHPEPVQQVIVGHGLKHLYDIQVDGNVIEATYNHPFWVVDLQTFVWAQDLVPGEHLLLADGRAPPITAISNHDEVTTVYNLSIANIHTFFVGAVGALVHNLCQTAAARLLSNLRNGNKAADAIASRYSDARREVTKVAASGIRRLDVFTKFGKAIESKVGLTGLTKTTTRQMTRDLELLFDPNSDVRELEWRFSPSPVTGLKGPTPALREALDAIGIPWI
jgi:hypothetical protein